MDCHEVKLLLKVSVQHMKHFVNEMACVIEIDVFPLVQVCFSAASSMRALCSTRTLDELYENLK